MSTEQVFTKTGGARIGWVNATWPLAKLHVTNEQLTLSALFLGTYTFSKDQMLSLEKYGYLPILAWGVRIRHNVPHYPEKIVFWSFGNPTSIISTIQEMGFKNTHPVATPVKRGVPIKWTPVVGLILLWNFFILLDKFFYSNKEIPLGWGTLVAVLLFFLISLGILKSKKLQTFF